MPSGSRQKTFKIENELGLHLRAAGRFAQCAGKFAAEIWVRKDGVEVNGKSIMGVLSLAACQGTEISVRVSGKDADRALAALGELIQSKFNEN